MDIEFLMSVSMLEIYKETLYDLLSFQKADLKIKESPVRGIYVEGLNTIVSLYVWGGFGSRLEKWG